MKTIKKIFIVCLSLCLVAGIIFVCGINEKLKVQPYEIDTNGKVKEPVRIAQISDLHACSYGENMEVLLNAVDEQKPDVVVLSGDIFDVLLPYKNVETVLKAVGEKYPCYYVTGNHEFFGGENMLFEMMDILKKYGIKRLSGESEILKINGNEINICGVDDPIGVEYTNSIEKSFEKQLEEICTVKDNGNYTVLISHRPERINEYSQYGFDLVLSGHAHGGQWRVPFLINGLVAPDQGIFPKYAGGFYEKSSTKMIVSRGLATRDVRSVPRIYNRPELVIIDLK